MGTISDEDIQKVREASDLVSVVGERVSGVRQKGRDFWCCCPLHNEKTPSFKMDPSTQLWHCFGCGEGGDVFAFVMKTEDMNFPDAVRYLAERAHIEIAEQGGKPGMGSGQKARLKAVCAKTAEYYHAALMRDPSPGPASARSYLHGRGLGGSVPKTWQLGYAPGRGALVRHLRALGFTNDEMLQANVAYVRNGMLTDRFYERVMFPILDVQGDCIAFGGRVIGSGEPKYLNSQETPLFHKSQVLYGIDKAKAAMAASGTAIVVEGYTDVIALHEAGVKNVVATLGTALTSQHIRLLSRHARKRIVYLFDGDEAGQRAADRALAYVDAALKPGNEVTGIDLLAVTLPDDLDPAEFVAARGADALRGQIAGAKELVLYGIDRRLDKADLSTAEGRASALVDAISVLAPIKDSLPARDYARQIAAKTRMREEDAMDALHALKAPRRTEGRSAFEQNGPAPAEAQASQAPSPAPAPARLTSEERDRRSHEQQLLSLAAQHPQIALSHADALAQTNWHDPACAAIAQSLLDTLANDPASTPAQLVTAASRAVPAAATMLTGIRRNAPEDPEALAEHLIERLAIDELHDQIDQIHTRLAHDPGLSEQDMDLLYQVAGELQQQLNQRMSAFKH